MDKMLLQKAIKDIESYSNSKKKIFSLLLELAEDNEVSISAQSLIKMTGLTMPTVYTALKTLQKDEVIFKNPSSPNSFKFNKDKLDKIQSSYTKKITMMSN
jgi:DNA-binding MarR family transcriptional regulator